MRTLGWIFYAQAGMPNKRLGQSKPVWRALNEGEAPGPNWTKTRELPIPCKCLKELAGTTGLEPAASAVTGQRSNQLNYVPSLFFFVREAFGFLCFDRSIEHGKGTGSPCPNPARAFEHAHLSMRVCKL